MIAECDMLLQNTTVAPAQTLNWKHLTSPTAVKPHIVVKPPFSDFYRQTRMTSETFGMYSLVTADDTESDWMASLSDEYPSPERKPDFVEVATAIQALPTDVVMTHDIALAFHGEAPGGLKAHKYNKSVLIRTLIPTAIGPAQTQKKAIPRSQSR